MSKTGIGAENEGYALCRQKDLEQAAEKANAQRKRDQADAREQSCKLLVNIDDLDLSICRWISSRWRWGERGRFRVHHLHS